MWVGPEKRGARGLNGLLFVRFFACQLTGESAICVEDLVMNAGTVVELCHVLCWTVEYPVDVVLSGRGKGIFQEPEFYPVSVGLSGRGKGIFQELKTLYRVGAVCGC